MKQYEAIRKYYEAGFTWLDACVHDYDDIYIEIPNGKEEIMLFQALYQSIIAPIYEQADSKHSTFVGFERGENENSLRLYFGYPVSDCMESADGTKAIVEHLDKLIHAPN